MNPFIRSDGRRSSLTLSLDTKSPVDLQVNQDDPASWPMIQKSDQPLSGFESEANQKRYG